jgi:hypothetical protein
MTQSRRDLRMAASVRRAVTALDWRCSAMAGLAGFSMQPDAGSLHVEVGTAIVAALLLLAGAVRYVPRIIRELTIRKVVRQVTDKKLGTAEGSQLVDLLTKTSSQGPSGPGKAPRNDEPPAAA